MRQKPLTARQREVLVIIEQHMRERATRRRCARSARRSA